MTVILDQFGKPLASSEFSEKAPYAASAMGRELASWTPSLNTADGDLLPSRDTMVARSQDMIRNHGIASGAVQIHLDNIIGTGLRLSYKPDAKALGIDPEASQEFARDVEAKFRSWANDNINFSSDAGLRLTQGGRLAQGYRSYMGAGEVLAVAEWIKNRPFRFRTAIQMTDPLRLSNPMGTQDRLHLRAGVELDKHGAPTHYHIREANVLDQVVFGMSAGVGKWKRIARTTAWGRQQVLHLFDQERPGQTRGKPSIVSVLSKMKMLEKLDQVTLQAAIVNAMYAAVLESALPTESTAAALGGQNPLASYMAQKTVWGDNGPVKFDGVKIPQLYPGEQLKLLSPQHPSVAFQAFTEKALQYVSGGFNLSYEQLARDYSKSNYSSARAAMMEAWKFFNGKRYSISAQQATWEFSLWLEEAIDNGTVVLPKGAPDFYENKPAWCRCFWIGPGRENIDPLKEGKAAREKYDLGSTTLEKLCAEDGEDWEEIITQRAYEKRMLEKHGLSDTIGKPRSGADKKVIDQQDREDDQEDEEEKKPSKEEQE